MHMKYEKKPVRGVIFDKDGTLHDTEVLFNIAWHRAAEELRVPDIDATIRACTGRNRHDMSLVWAEKYPPDIPFDPFVELRNRYYFAMVEKEVPVKSGALEVLRTLRAQGIRVGLATSSTAGAARDQLHRSGMDGLFDAIVTGDMVVNGKPDPEIYLRAAAMMGVSPDECVGVEDAPNGVHAVFNAGMRVVMVPDTIAPTPDIEALLWHKCDALTDLLPLIEAENG